MALFPILDSSGETEPGTIMEMALRPGADDQPAITCMVRHLRSQLINNGDILRDHTGSLTESIGDTLLPQHHGRTKVTKVFSAL